MDCQVNVRILPKFCRFINDSNGKIRDMSESVKLLTLILSHDDGPWKKIQDQGQDLTFIPESAKNSIVLRYSGSAKRLPRRYQLALSLKRYQHDAWKYSNFRLFGLIMKLFANMRVFDNVIDRISSITSEGEADSVEFSLPGKSWNIILTKLPTDRALIISNTILAFRHVLKSYDFDYLFRTNTSSYVDSSKLLKFLEAQGRNNIYGGLVGRLCQNIEFASGAGILLSRDLVEKLCDPKIKYKHGYVDDVAMGVAIAELGKDSIPILPLPRLDAYNLTAAISIDSQRIKENFHFRCKSNSAEETIEVMQYIHSVKQCSNDT